MIPDPNLQILRLLPGPSLTLPPFPKKNNIILPGYNGWKGTAAIIQSHPKGTLKPLPFKSVNNMTPVNSLGILPQDQNPRRTSV